MDDLCWKWNKDKKNITRYFQWKKWTLARRGIIEEVRIMVGLCLVWIKNLQLSQNLLERAGCPTNQLIEYPEVPYHYQTQKEINVQGLSARL